MNPLDHSEDVAGIDEPAAADLESLGVPTDTDDRIATVRARVHWKARAMQSEREVSDLRGALRRARVLGALAFALALVALIVAVAA